MESQSKSSSEMEKRECDLSQDLSNLDNISIRPRGNSTFTDMSVSVVTGQEGDCSSMSSSPPQSLKNSFHFNLNPSLLREEEDKDSTFRENEGEIESEKGRKVEEKSGDGRFLKFSECLESTYDKKVFLGLDTDSGMQVAWNSFEVKGDKKDKDKDIDKILGEISVLEKIEHPNIIKLIRGFFNEKKGEVVLINELLTGSSLKDYLDNMNYIRLRAIKNWCIEILKGLKYLHSQNPPIIHRNIKTDNIYIDKSKGNIKIGYCGLGSFINMSDRQSKESLVYLSPESLKGKWVTKSDCYSFGMTLLEIVTKEIPYKECNNNKDLIYDKASKNIFPESIYKIRNKRLKNFIVRCLRPDNLRPSITELLADPFLKDLDSEENNFPPLNYPTEKLTYIDLYKINSYNGKEPNQFYYMNDLNYYNKKPKFSHMHNTIHFNSFNKNNIINNIYGNNNILSRINLKYSSQAKSPKTSSKQPLCGSFKMRATNYAANMRNPVTIPKNK